MDSIYANEYFDRDWECTHEIWYNGKQIKAIAYSQKTPGMFDLLFEDDTKQEISPHTTLGLLITNDDYTIDDMDIMTRAITSALFLIEQGLVKEATYELYPHIDREYLAFLKRNTTAITDGNGQS